MTDHLDPQPDPLDDLASAYLDGVCTPEEIARVETDPAMRARVEELRAVQAAVGAPVPVDAEHRDRAVAAALAAFHDADPGTGGTGAAPVPLSAVAARRRRSSVPARRVLGIAAALALLALLVPVLGSLSDSRDDDRASTAADAFDDAAEDAADGGGPESGDGETSTAADPTARALGAFEDLDALVGALELDAESLNLNPPSSVTEAPASGGADPDARCPTDFTEGTVASFTATLAGEPVEVLVITDDAGARSVTVLHAGTCDLVASRAL